MLMNNLDPEVAERPEELVVYGGIGRAARDWESFDRIVATLRRLEDDETLLVQSGKPVGVFRTHADAPRVLIANSNLVPHWATWEHFNELDRKGLMMYGQMTAGSWIYIGAQGIVQGTYETFVEMGRQHYGGDLAGRWILTAGLGGMGGAQPLAAVHGRRLAASPSSASPSRIEMRLRTGYLDVQANDLDEALAIIERSCASKKAGLGRRCSATPPKSARSSCGAACGPTSSPTRPRRTIRSTAICPTGWTLDAVGGAARERSRRRSSAPPSASMAEQVRAMLDFHEPGVPTVDYGNNIRQMAKEEGVDGRLRLSRASCRPTSGRCSAAASGRSAGRRCRAIRRTSTGPTPR